MYISSTIQKEVWSCWQYVALPSKNGVLELYNFISIDRKTKRTTFRTNALFGQHFSRLHSNLYEPHMKWMDDSCPKALSGCDSNTFSDFHAFLQLARSRPVAQCGCQRRVSAQRQLHMYVGRQEQNAVFHAHDSHTLTHYGWCEQHLSVDVDPRIRESGKYYILLIIIVHGPEAEISFIGTPFGANASNGVQNRSCVCNIM